VDSKGNYRDSRIEMGLPHVIPLVLPCKVQRALYTRDLNHVQNTIVNLWPEQKLGLPYRKQNRVAINSDYELRK
jgi:hypothetical protein